MKVCRCWEKECKQYKNKLHVEKADDTEKAIPKRRVPIKHVIFVVLKVIRKPSISSRSQKRHQHARRRNTKRLKLPHQVLMCH